VRRRVGFGLVVLAAGVALAQAFAPLEWHWLAWVALVPILVAAMVEPPRAAFLLGWLGGLAFFVPLLRWLDFTFTMYSAIPWPLTWGPIVLLAGYCALWVGAVCTGMAVIARSAGVGWASAAAPFLWVAAEWGRGQLFGGFPWGLVAYSQYARLPVIQVAELGGVWMVSFVIVAVNAAIAAALLLRGRRAIVGLAMGALVVTLTLWFGSGRLAVPLPRGEVRIAVMQPAIEQPLKWDERYTHVTAGIYFTLTDSVGADGADLIVWPETASPVVLRRDPAYTAALVDRARRLRTPLLVGSVDVGAGAPPGGGSPGMGEPPVLTNTAFLLTERGVTGRYDKIQLVPFGEYVPLAWLIGFVRGWAEFISEMEPGTKAVVFPGPPAPFGVVICYEGIFPGLVREFVRGGARLMINMTNDAWFGTTSGPRQHLAMYPFRAVEHRTALARSANTGISAFIEPTGHIRRSMPLFERGIMVESLPLRDGETVYTRFGDWFAYLALAVAVGMIGAGFAMGRR
jgi:apolipoprotein N-acyltransferase